MTTVLGVDPGMKGGWVLMGDVNASGRMPIADNGVDVTFFSDLICDNDLDLIVIEKLQVARGWSQADGAQQSPASGFQMGREYGKLIGVAQAFRANLLLVHPQTWKSKVIGDRKADKQDAIEFVQRCYPQIDLVPGRCRMPQDGIADACCIAHHGMVNHLGAPPVWALTPMDAPLSIRWGGE